MLSKAQFGSELPTNDDRENGLFTKMLYTLKHSVKRAAIIETLIFLSGVLVLNMFFGDGNRFMNVSPHPFWIIVVLITLQYGANEAIVAAFLASAFLIAGNLPEQSLTETMYEYILRLLSLPFLWVVTALILGGIRTRQLNERTSLREKLKNSRRAVDKITENYNEVRQTKEQLELRLASEKCSILTVYEVAKSMETTDPSEIPAAISKLVNVALNPIKFSIFLFKGDILRLDTAYGWKKADAYCAQFTMATPLAQSIFNKESFALSVANESDELTLMGQGIMAGPIVDKRSGKVFGMLKIEEMKFTDLGARSRETFLLVCEWIAYVFTNAEKCRAGSDISSKSIDKIDYKKSANLNNANNNTSAKIRSVSYAD